MVSGSFNSTREARPSVHPDPPIHDSPEQERTFRKQRLAAVYRVFAQFGFDAGVSGHVSVRDPILTDHFWLNPYGRYFGHIRASDLLLVSPLGEVVEGDGRLHRAAFSIHSRVLEARPDIVSVAHAHTISGKAWATRGRLLEPITQDSLAFHGDHALCDYTGVSLGVDEGKHIAAALSGFKACILRNHGLLTVGHTVDEAAWWLICLDQACEVQLLAESDGQGPQLIDREIAERDAPLAGSANEGWLNFQPYWQRVVAEQPDLLE